MRLIDFGKNCDHILIKSLYTEKQEIQWVNFQLSKQKLVYKFVPNKKKGLKSYTKSTPEVTHLCYVINMKINKPARSETVPSNKSSELHKLKDQPDYEVCLYEL